MKLITFDSRLWEAAKSKGFIQKDMEHHIGRAASDAAKLLPDDFRFLNIVMSPARSEAVIPETGCMGMTYSDEYISITFDPNLPYGLDSCKKSLRSTVFHEMVHAVTFAHDEWRPDAMFGVVSEGMATVFEREYVDNNQPLWGEYQDDETMQAWYKEIKALPDFGYKNHDYFIRHPDGRKWMVYKTGAWMIDKLLAADEDLFDLMKLSHGEIIDKFESLEA